MNIISKLHNPHSKIVHVPQQGIAYFIKNSSEESSFCPCFQIWIGCHSLGRESECVTSIIILQLKSFVLIGFGQCWLRGSSQVIPTEALETKFTKTLKINLCKQILLVHFLNFGGVSSNDRGLVPLAHQLRKIRLGIRQLV